MKTQAYNLILQPEPEGGFTVLVPALPGCVTYGKTLEEAKEMAVDAIRGYLASVKKQKQTLPQTENGFFTTVQV